MSYCDANTDVKILTGFASTYSTSSIPTLSDVQNIIGQIEGEINAYLAADNITSPSNANTLALLKRYEALGSAGMVLARWGDNDAVRQQGMIFWNEFKEWANRLLNDQAYIQMIIKNENKANEGQQVGSAVTAGILPTPHSTAINNGQGTYINEKFTF